MIEKLTDLKKNLLDNSKKYKNSIGILTHVFPDGDGLPASLALKELLAFYDLESQFILEKDPDDFHYLDLENNFITYSDELQFDLIIVLDCHEESRLGVCKPLLKKAKKVMTIDHHVKRNLIPGSENFINTNFACIGEIIFELFEEEIKKLEPKVQNLIAKCIYTSILNDTGNFINQNTDERTFDIARKLLKYNIVPGEIYTNLFLNHDPYKIMFIGEVLHNMKLHEDDSFLFINSDQKMLDKYKLTNDDTAKITTWVRGTLGIKCVVYFREVEDNFFRLSMRSDFIKVNKICEIYGGGGHEKAAGCPIDGSLEEVQNKILTNLKEFSKDERYIIN